MVLRGRMESEYPIKERSAPDIAISMSLGDEMSDTTESQRRL
jgi:hypothetical protein